MTKPPDLVEATARAIAVHDSCDGEILPFDLYEPEARAAIRAVLLRLIGANDQDRFCFWDEDDLRPFAEAHGIDLTEKG